VRRVLLTLLAASILAGCGSANGSLPDASLVLDFTPNAVHAGIYSALAHHYDLRHGVRLHVIAPSASTDSIQLLAAGRVDVAILDIHDLALARERGVPLVGVMAIVERPLAAVIAQPQIADPGQLQGRLVGVTGVPSDTAVLHSIVSGAGGDPARVHTITIGFNAVPDLPAGRVNAATAFWNDEGVALNRARPGFHVFRVDSYGAPPYPELVLTTTQALLRRRPALALGVVRALEQGYRFTLAHPRAAAAELESQVPGLSPSLVSADLKALGPAFAGPDGQPGVLDRSVLESWARWEARFGIVTRPVALDQTFDFTGSRGLG
jgi:NitT/TauT family transport system substrate-binding protein/putative hydroxymethylpyrimidine transport system substrate-binding protein